MAKKAQKSFWEENKVNIIGWALVILTITGFFALSNYLSQQADISRAEVLVVGENEIVKGNPESENILIEYSDFQCPACAGYYPTAKEFIEEYGDDVQLVYRHFPLSIHPNADEAAIASEAAREQGKFWEMHDLLFENQEEWAAMEDVNEYFIELAEDLELDAEKFTQDLDSEELANRIEADAKAGFDIGVNSTPSFFFNGEEVTLVPTLESFAALIGEVPSNETN